MKDDVPVLIVGAGPTGLMMACQLTRFHIPFRIIEKNEGSTTQSRALVIQPRSLEIFEQMGIARPAIEQGQPFEAINYVVNGKLAKRVPLGDFGRGLTQFPFLLILEQSKTEPLLIDFLARQGKSVEWRTELVKFRQNGDDVSATLKHDGKVETIETQWLIGADGGRSTVREALDIPFGGETYSESLFVLDCKINWQFKDDEAAIALSKDAFGLFFPMTNGRCRVSGIVSEEYADKETISFEEVNLNFAKDLKMDVTLSDPQWISLYHAHHRYVANFRKGRYFLAGDAAHIHSPVGAQGMNTGLQDAYNLAWKLALVIQGKAKEELLDSYQDERLPIARRLVRTTDRLFGITVSHNPLIASGRVYLMPRIVALLPKEKHAARFAFRLVSQIGIHYRDSSLSRDASKGSFPINTAKPGDRLPFVLFQEKDKSVNIQDKVKDPTLHLFLFSGYVPTNASEIDEFQRLAIRHDVQTKVVPLRSETKTLYKTFGIKNNGFYVVRPDMYIACRSSRLEVEFLRNYFLRIFPK